jgi:hypothetical protein
LGGKEEGERGIEKQQQRAGRGKAIKIRDSTIRIVNALYYTT